MPRTLRASAANSCYHVPNRGNRRERVFHDDGDYAALVAAIAEASLRIPMRVLAFCLMPNHFHLVLWPEGDGDLSRMHWLMTAHVRRYLRVHRSGGHVWQGRFRAFPIEVDGHLLTVLRYVERNPLRDDLVGRAEDWPWLSLHPAPNGALAPMLDPGPESARRGADWAEGVNAAMAEAELERLRRSVARRAPFGSTPWTAATAARLGLESSLNPPGRPPSAGPASSAAPPVSPPPRSPHAPR
jgi:putative transposase